MKKLLLSVLVLTCVATAIAQPVYVKKAVGTSANIVTTGGALIAPDGAVIGLYNDTTQANSKRIKFYHGAQIVTRNPFAIWLRDSANFIWLKQGSCSDGLKAGGVVLQKDTTTFSISAALYSIGCVLHLSRDTVITLATSPIAPNKRIDVFAVNTSNLTVNLTGTPALFPVPAPVNLATQIPLNFVFLTHDTAVITGGPPASFWIGSGNDIYNSNTGRVGIGGIPISPNRLDVYNNNNQTGFGGIALRNTTPATDLLRYQLSGGIYLESQVRDTFANSSLTRGWYMIPNVTPGRSAPIHVLLFMSSDSIGKYPLAIYNTGQVSFVSAGFNFYQGTMSRPSGTMTFSTNNNGAATAFQFVNPTLPLTATTTWTKFFSGGAASANGSVTVGIFGDNNDTSMAVHPNGKVTLGNGATKKYAGLSLNEKGRYFVGNVMNTSQINGITWNITGTSIGVAGTGLIRPPRIFATNVLGGRAAQFTSTISGGGLATITVVDGGSSYFAGGSLGIDTIGCTVGGPFVLPTATYTVTHGTYEPAGMVFNSDSGHYYNYNPLAAAFEQMSGGGPGGPAYTLPIASAGTLGGIKIGTGLTVAGDGTVNATAGTGFTLSTIGTSGAATFISGVLNIPNYASATASNVGGGLAIFNNKTGINLEFNTFNPNDFNLASNLYSIDYVNGQAASSSAKGFLPAADWITFNTKQNAITFTTTGTSGNATFIGGVMNIPNYTAGGLAGILAANRTASNYAELDSLHLFDNTNGAYATITAGAETFKFGNYQKAVFGTIDYAAGSFTVKKKAGFSWTISNSLTGNHTYAAPNFDGTVQLVAADSIPVPQNMVSQGNDGRQHKSAVTAIYTGGFSQVASAVTTFTVTFGVTLANNTYRAFVTPTANVAAAPFYITNKTTTTFDVVYLSALTGTVTFDYSLFP